MPVYPHKDYAWNPTPKESTFRRQKARESLLLSVYLNSIKATTYSIFEATRITAREVSPEALDAFETHGMVIWTHYVKDTVLPNWTMISPSNGDGEPVASAPDALLVEKAKEFGVPLVTHEGLTVDGINPKSGIRKNAQAAGVTIMSACEFYGDIDELLYGTMFPQAYRRDAEAYIAGHSHQAYMREHAGAPRLLWAHSVRSHGGVRPPAAR
jgi:hypothetical protein